MTDGNADSGGGLLLKAVVLERGGMSLAMCLKEETSSLNVTSFVALVKVAIEARTSFKVGKSPIADFEVAKILMMARRNEFISSQNLRRSISESSPFMVCSLAFSRLVTSIADTQQDVSSRALAATAGFMVRFSEDCAEAIADLEMALVSWENTVCAHIVALEMHSKSGESPSVCSDGIVREVSSLRGGGGADLL